MTAAAALKLYEATDALQVVAEWLEENDELIRASEGAIPDELAELLAKAEGDFNVKAERVALFIQERLGQSKLVKDEADRLAARAARLKRHAETLKRYLHAELLRARIQKVEGKLISVRVQNSPPAVEGDVAEGLLEQLWRRAEESEVEDNPERGLVVRIPESFTLNRTAVLQAVKAEQALPPELAGVEVTRGTHVRLY